MGCQSGKIYHIWTGLSPLRWNMLRIHDGMSTRSKKHPKHHWIVRTKFLRKSYFTNSIDSEESTDKIFGNSKFSHPRKNFEFTKKSRDDSFESGGGGYWVNFSTSSYKELWLVYAMTLITANQPQLRTVSFSIFEIKIGISIGHPTFWIINFNLKRENLISLIFKLIYIFSLSRTLEHHPQKLSAYMGRPFRKVQVFYLARDKLNLSNDIFLWQLKK